MDFSNPDDITRTGERDFDDGFVYKDKTDRPDNGTVNFGYQNNSQHDPADLPVDVPTIGALTFHRKNDVSGAMFLGQGTEYRKTVRTNYDEVISANENFGAGGALPMKFLHP